MYPNSKVGYNNLTHAHTYLLFRVLPRKQVRFFFIMCVYIYIYINPRTISSSFTCLFQGFILSLAADSAQTFRHGEEYVSMSLRFPETSSLLLYFMLWFLMSEMVPVFYFSESLLHQHLRRYAAKCVLFFVFRNLIQCFRSAFFFFFFFLIILVIDYL